MKKTNVVLLAKSDKLSATQRKSIGAGEYVKRIPHPNEAKANQISKMAGNYTPPVWSGRQGALDHLLLESVG